MSTEEVVVKVSVEDAASPQLKNLHNQLGKTRDANGRFVKQQLTANEALAKGAKEAAASALGVRNLSAVTLGAAGAMAVASVAAEALAAAFELTSDALVSSIKNFAGFEAALIRSGAVTSDATGQLVRMEEAAINAGLATTFSAREAAEAMTALGQAGFTATQQISAVRPVLDLANIGNVNLAKSADIASNVLSAYGFKASELADVNDRLATTFTSTNTTLAGLGKSFEFVGPIAKATSQDFDALLAQIGVLGNLGIKGSKAGTGLRAALSSLAKPSREGATALAALNVETRDGQGQIRQLTDIVKDLGETGATTAEIIAIFGKVGGTAIQALVDNAGQIDTLTASIKGSEGAAARMAETINSSLDAQAKILSGTIETLSIQVGSQFKPVLVETTKELTKQAAALAKDDEFMKRFAGTGRDLQIVMAQLLLVGADVVVLFGHIAGASLEVAKHGDKVVTVLTDITTASVPMAALARDAMAMSEALGVTATEADGAGSAYGRAVGTANKLAESMRTVARETDPTRNGIKLLSRDIRAFATTALATSTLFIANGKKELTGLMTALFTTADAYNFTARETRQLAAATEKANAAAAKRNKALAEEANRLNSSLSLRRAGLAVLNARSDQAKILAGHERDLLRINQAATKEAEKRLDRDMLAIETGRKLAALREQEGAGVMKLAAAVDLELRRQSIIEARSKGEKLLLDVELRRVQATRAALAIEDETLQALALKTAEMQAQDALSKGMAALKKEDAEQIKKDQDEAATQLAAFNTELLAGADAFSAFDQAGNAAFSSLGAGMAGVTRLAADLNTLLNANAKGTAAAGKAAASALATAGQATAGFAAALGASAAQQAGILAGFEGAASLASFASGNIPSGIQHGAAAAGFAAVAAQGGGSVPSGGGSGGGAGAGAAASVGGGEVAQQRGAEILADVLADKLDGGGGQTINFDFRGSNILNQEELYTLVNESASAHGIDLNDVGRG